MRNTLWQSSNCNFKQFKVKYFKYSKTWVQNFNRYKDQEIGKTTINFTEVKSFL